MTMVYARNAGVIETDLKHELVLLDPATQQMFRLNETGRVVWQMLPVEGEGSLVDAVVARFEVSREDAERDVRRLLSELAKAQLVETRGT